MRHLLILATFLLTVNFLLPLKVVAQYDDVAFFIRQRIEHGQQFTPQPDTLPLFSAVFLPDFYVARNFEPAWTDPENVRQAFQAIRSAADEGLQPADYHLTRLQRLYARVAGSLLPDRATVATFDLLLTDAVSLLAYHFFFGKVSPKATEPTWNFPARPLPAQPVLLLQQALDQRQVYQQIRALLPAHSQYQTLRQALQTYRAIQTKGGWPALPTGQTLKPGMEDTRLLLLGQRLEAEGFLPAGHPHSTLFDSTLYHALRSFQLRYGLEPDGTLGKQTTEELSRPVEARIDQIRANLERGRWILSQLDTTYLMVNIAGFELFVRLSGNTTWNTKVIIGKAYTKTPVFQENLRYIVFNPTWTVPPGILRSSFSKMKKAPAEYLQSNGLQLIDRDGNTVSAASIDWNTASARNFPYTLMQSPGRNNSLGVVKFMFPNEHSVYLHDTPQKALFERSERAFSHGCVRVKDPLTLAHLILSQDQGWTEEQVQRAVAAGNTRTVILKTPIPVLILYWTAGSTAEGSLFFRRDLYDRDPKVMENLNMPSSQWLANFRKS